MWKKNEDDETDFTVTPAQITVEPHKNRSVRIQWVGATNLKGENAYRVIAEQLPDKPDKEKTATEKTEKDKPDTEKTDTEKTDKEKTAHTEVKFRVIYNTALFVSPQGLSQRVTLDSFAAIKDAKEEKVLKVVLDNQGTQHALLRNLKLTLTDAKDNTVSLSGDQLKNMTGETILAGYKTGAFLSLGRKIWSDRRCLLILPTTRRRFRVSAHPSWTLDKCADAR